MQKTVTILAALLAVQLVLVVAMSFSGHGLAAVRPDTPLISLGDHKVDRVEIDAPDKRRLVLVRRDKGWVLPGSDGFPADQAKVDHLISTLKGLQRGFAVATTAGAQKRFLVSDADYKRKLVLAQGDTALATVYFGTSPGLRRVHARTAKDAAVYATGFGLYDAPLEAEAWEDKALLHVPAADIEKIDLADVSLSRLPPTASASGDQSKVSEGPWTDTALPAGEVVNQAHSAEFVQQVAALGFASVLGTKALPDYGLETPRLTFKVERKNGTVETYRLGRRDKQKDYVLKVSSRPEYFRLTGAGGEALIEAAGRDRLVSATPVAATMPVVTKPSAAATKPSAPVPVAGTGHVGPHAAPKGKTS